MKSFFSFFILLFVVICFSTKAQTVIKFGELNFKNGKVTFDKHHLEFESGNTLIAHANEKSILDTLPNYRKIGIDRIGNRYFFTNNPKNILGVMMFEEELGIKIYCDRQQIFAVHVGKELVESIDDKNCGFDVITFENCGFYNFSYSIEKKEIYFLEKRLLLPDKERKISLIKYL